MSANRRILKDTLMVTVIGALAQGIGFFIPVLVASRFGTTPLTDAYYLAVAVPDLLTGIIIGGAIKIVFVPVLVEERIKRPDDVPHIVGASVWIVLLLSGVGVLILGVGAAGGILELSQDASTAILSQQLILGLLPLVPLTLLFSLFNAIYNAHQRFALAEVAQAVDAALMIACILLLTGSLGIYSLVVGQVIGQAAAVVVVARHTQHSLGLSLRPRRSLPAGFKRMLKLSALPFAAVLLSQLNPFVARLMSGYLSVGSVSVLSYAQRLVSIPSLFIGASFGAVLTSHWSKFTAEDNSEALRISLNRGLSTLIAIMLPLTVGLILLRAPLVNVVYRRGAFDAAAASATGDVFAILGVQIIPTYLQMVIVRVLLAEKAVQSLFWLNLLNTSSNFAFMFLFVQAGLGVQGVALGMLLSAILSTLVTAVVVHRRYVALSLAHLLKTTTQTSVAAGIMALAVMGIQTLMPRDAFVFDLATIAVSGLVGSAICLVVLRLLGHPDITSIWNLIVARLSRMRVARSR
jgi:putative peptidoglycan lipid II flippase